MLKRLYLCEYLLFRRGTGYDAYRVIDACDPRERRRTTVNCGPCAARD